MANGIETQRDLYGTFLRWAKEGHIPEKELPHKESGEVDGPKVVAYVLSHSDKFSPKIQKEIEILKKAFALLGFVAPEVDKLLTDSPAGGAKRLVEKGQELEGKAKALPAGSKDAEKAWGFAEKSYRLALQMDRDNSGAHRALADLMYRRHQTEAAREHASAAVRVADPKDLVGIVQWLQGAGDAKIARALAVNFVAKELIATKRYHDAKTLYELASSKAAELGDKEKARKFHEKALVADELGTPYKLGFDRKSNPEAMKLFEALRKSGIPTGLMEGGSSNGDRKLDAVELMKFSSSDDPRVVQVRGEIGLEPPPWAGKKGLAKLAFASEKEKAAFEALPWNEKLSFYHSRLADQAKTDAEKLCHLQAAAHFGPGSADANRNLAEFFVAQGKDEPAIAAYLAVVGIVPDSADDRKALGDLYLKQERWQEASQYLPVAESVPILLDKAENAGSWLATQDIADLNKMVAMGAKALERTAQNLPTPGKQETVAFSKEQLIEAKKSSEQVSKALEDLEKNFATLSKDDQASVLRVRARLDLVLGRIKVAEGDLDAAKAKYQSSLEASERVLALVPNDASALLNRAEAYERAGNYEKAMADYQTLLQSAPNSLGEIYTDFRTRYQGKLRSDFRTEMDNFRRQSYEKSWTGQRDALVAMWKLSNYAETLRKFPTLSQTDRFENLKLAREFYNFRVQFWESKSLQPFEGFKPAHDIIDIAKNSYAQIEETKKITALLEDIHYTDNLALYQKDVSTVEAEMIALRDAALPTLNLKPGELSTVQQLDNAQAAAGVDREFGYYSGLADVLDQWKTLMDALPATSMESSFRVEVYGQIMSGWKVIRGVDERKYAMPLPSDHDINLKMLDVFHGANFEGPGLKSAAKAFATSEGLAWDEKAFEAMYHQAFVGDDTQDARFRRFFTPDGMRTFFSANQQANSDMNQAGVALQQDDYVAGRAKAVEALQLYAQLGNADKVKETIEYIENMQYWVKPEDEGALSTIDTLDMQSKMFDALRGSGIRTDDGGVLQAYEDMMLEKATRTANSLKGNDYSYNNVGIQGMMAARNFFDQLKDQESVNEIDKNLKEHQSTMRDHISFLVDSNEHGAEHDMKAYGAEWSMYKPEVRQGQVMEAGSLLQTDLALIATQDISKEEVRKELGKQLMNHADLWRRMIETNPDLPADFRLEQTKQLAATLAMFKKSFTEGDTPILQADALKAPTEAVGKLASSILKDNDYYFFPSLGGNQDWAVQEMRQHGLGSRLENGILGYYIDRGSDSTLKALDKQDWAEIEKIKTMYSGDWAMAETSIKVYLTKAGKFRELSDDEIAQKDAIATDFQERLARAQTDSDAQFFTALNPGFVRGFAQADVQAHEILAESRNAAIPFEDRLEKSMEAAQAFGQLGIENRMEEALKPVKDHIETLKDNPAQQASGYYSLAQLYEVSGMDKKAKEYFNKVGAMDPGDKAVGQQDKSLHELAVFSLAKIQLADNKVAEAKKLLGTIRENSLAAEYLQKLDDY
ncbi:MAG: tetratricopeptide repeat protein, partial [Deltaproteobacteria bacterium]|nr:tetratricopeptide repeat protein [Deltaproteobacteria bacterium]